VLHLVGLSLLEGKTEQAVRERESEKADSKRSLKGTEEKRGDLGNV